MEGGRGIWGLLQIWLRLSGNNNTYILTPVQTNKYTSILPSSFDLKPFWKCLSGIFRLTKNTALNLGNVRQLAGFEKLCWTDSTIVFLLENGILWLLVDRFCSRKSNAALVLSFFSFVSSYVHSFYFIFLRKRSQLDKSLSEFKLKIQRNSRKMVKFSS